MTPQSNTPQSPSALSNRFSYYLTRVHRRHIGAAAQGSAVYAGRSRAQEAPNPLGNPFPVAGKSHWSSACEQACRDLEAHLDADHPVRQAIAAARANKGFAQGQAVSVYEAWLRLQLTKSGEPTAQRLAVLELARRLVGGEELSLQCFCAQGAACHTDVLRQAVASYAARTEQRAG